LKQNAKNSAEKVEMNKKVSFVRETATLEKVAPPDLNLVIEDREEKYQFHVYKEGELVC